MNKVNDDKKKRLESSSPKVSLKEERDFQKYGFQRTFFFSFVGLSIKKKTWKCIISLDTFLTCEFLCFGSDSSAGTSLALYFCERKVHREEN